MGTILTPFGIGIQEENGTKFEGRALSDLPSDLKATFKPFLSTAATAEEGNMRAIALAFKNCLEAYWRDLRLLLPSHPIRLES